jgi:hypothetical protein
MIAQAAGDRKEGSFLGRDVTIKNMSKSRNNPSFHGLSAMLGDRLVIRKVRGQYQLVNRPPKRRKPTPGQAARREKFREASQYASRQISLVESRALYATGITRNKHTSYLVALSDYLNAPNVKHIDTAGYRGMAGDIIMIKATDDFMVTKVNVTITDAAGALIEIGEATRDALTADGWEYRVAVINLAWRGSTIRAVAYDRPGNTGMAEAVLQKSTNVNFLPASETMEMTSGPPAGFI